MGPPGWVFTYDALFQILFALITLGIGFFSLKIYFFSKQRQPKIFGLSFISISISFFILALLNFGILSFALLLPLQLDAQGLTRVFIASYMFFYMIGVVTLAYMTMKLKNDWAYHITLLIIFFAMIAATHKLYLFYSICTLLFAYISFYYFTIFKNKKQGKNFVVLLGFVFLFLGNLTLIFSVSNSFYYAAGHVLELAGYFSLFMNLCLVFKK